MQHIVGVEIPMQDAASVQMQRGARHPLHHGQQRSRGKGASA
ncbi:hypothetical protein [Aeromonas ichthyocola]